MGEVSKDVRMGRIWAIRLGYVWPTEQTFGVTFEIDGKEFGAEKDRLVPFLRYRGVENTSEDKPDVLIGALRHVKGLLDETREADISRLIGRSVEVEYEDGRLKSWKLI